MSAISASTAVGASVEQTAASIRAGVSRLREHAFYESILRDPEQEGGEPLVSGFVDGLSPELDGSARLYHLLAPVLADVLQRARFKRRDLRECALLVALPFPDAAITRLALDDAFVAEIEGRSGISFPVTRTSQSGHTGVFELVAEASQLLEERAVKACIVAGVDSYLMLDRMQALDEAYRLKSARNVDGFIPGEAAAALLLERPKRATTPALCTITGLGLGKEPETMRSERISTGSGLTGALRGAFSPTRAVEWVLCDLNGESYRAFEWGLALARLGERLGPLRKIVYPAMFTGDVGAATGAVLIASVAEAFKRGYATAEEAIAWTASEGPSRAAVRVERA